MQECTARAFLQLHIATCVFCYKRLLPNAKNIVPAPRGDDKRMKILFPRCTVTIKGENIVPAPHGDDKRRKILLPRRTETIKGENIVTALHGDDKKTKKLCVAQVLINFDLG